MTAAIILILLSVADIATTHRFLQLGIRGANPLMRWAFDTLGFKSVASALKLALTWQSLPAYASARVAAVGLLCRSGCCCGVESLSDPEPQ